MPNLYYPSPDEVQGAKPLNELVWFPRMQPQLMRLANTNEGRDLLLIDKYPYPVVAIGKNFVRFDMGWQDGQHMFKTDVRVGAKWGNVIRYRWQDFVKAVDHITLLDILAWPSIYEQNGKLLPRVGGGTTTTFYPEPDSEGSPTTVDGDVTNAVASTTWATVLDAATGTSADDSGNDLEIFISASTTTDEFEGCKRTVLLFNTSSIGVDTIVSATLETVYVYARDDFTSSVSVVTSTPASNTALVVEDYNQFGTTLLAANRTFASLTVNNSTYNAAALNATGLSSISKTGITKLGMRVYQDIQGAAGEPTWGSGHNSHLVAHSADRTGSTDPKLVVIHSGPFTPRAIMF
jgi:hypothetical protein